MQKWIEHCSRHYFGLYSDSRANSDSTGEAVVCSLCCMGILGAKSRALLKFSKTTNILLVASCCVCFCFGAVTLGMIIIFPQLLLARIEFFSV